MDYAEWNYRRVLGLIQRLRFWLALSLLPERCNRLLEIGYGSGVFMPSLHARAAELYGVDIHESSSRVQSVLASEGVSASLCTTPAETLPYPDHFFDSVVAVSSLEFVTDLNLVCREIRRVLKPAGSLIVITPGKSTVVDWGLRLLAGTNAKKDFRDARDRIVPTLSGFFSVDVRRRVPGFFSNAFTLYQALRLRNDLL